MRAGSRQGVAEQALQRGAGDGKRCAGENAQDDARQAQTYHHRALLRLKFPGQTDPQFPEQDGDNLRRGYGYGAGTDRQDNDA